MMGSSPSIMVEKNVGNDSWDDHDNSSSSRAPTMKHERLTLVRKNRNPMDYYVVEKILGSGSMGSVSKVIKRPSIIGGSARGVSVSSQWEKLIKCCRIHHDDDHDDGDDFHHHYQGAGSHNTNCNNNSFVLNSLEHGEEKGHSSSNNSNSNSKVFHASTVSSIVSFDHKDTYYALKSVHLELARSKTLREELRNEIEILKELDHPNIVRALETYEYRNSLYIVLELCSGGDLYTRDPYSEEQAARIINSVLSALTYMHSCHVTHRDLKYENVMFTNMSPTADIKIIDFGLSKKYAKDERLHQTVGTIYSMSPQVLQGSYTVKADVWSAGVLSFMLLSSSMPFFGKTRSQIRHKIEEGSYNFKNRSWRGVSQPAKEFVATLLTYNPDTRPSAAQALEIPWLRQNRTLLKQASSSVSERMDQVQASIEMYSTYSMMKKLGLMVIAHRSDSEEVGFLRRMFKTYDLDGDGTVSLDEFKGVLKDYHYTEEEMERIFHGVDVNGTGVIHYSEFLAATMEAHGHITEERIAEAFDHLDNDDTGYISAKNLHDFLGAAVPDTVLNKMIDDVDFLHLHKVNYEEFLAMWNMKQDSNMLKTRKLLSSRRNEPILNGGSGNTNISSPSKVENVDHHADHFFRSKASSIRSHKEVISSIKKKLVGKNRAQELRSAYI